MELIKSVITFFKKNKKLYLTTFLICQLLGIIYFSLTEKTFESRAQIMSANAESNALSLSGFSSFLPMGIVGEAKGPQIFSSLIKSDTFFNDLSKTEITIADSKELIGDYIKSYRGGNSNGNAQLEKYRNYKFYLENMISVRHDKLTGIVSVNIYSNSFEVSHQILQSTLNLLNKKLSQFSLNAKSSKKDFILNRITGIEDELKEVEEEYANFLSENQSILSSPTLTILKQRLERKISIKENILSQLATELEINKIEETRDNQVSLDIIEYPTMNPIKVAPSRSVIFLIATLISIVIPVILRFKDIVH
jgi:uncharacterized protein involved in exopolysaccharide biosynthesis